MDVKPVEDLLSVGQAGLFAGFALTEAATAGLAERGFADLRFAHGFVFQHLLGEPLGVSALAARMGVSQQAASKAVAELEALGYLERAPDPADRRRRAVTLAARGRAAVAAGREIGAAQDALLRERLGADRVDAARRLLLEVLELTGGLDTVRARRVRLPT